MNTDTKISSENLIELRKDVLANPHNSYVGIGISLGDNDTVYRFTPENCVDLRSIIVESKVYKNINDPKLKDAVDKALAFTSDETKSLQERVNKVLSLALFMFGKIPEANEKWSFYNVPERVLRSGANSYTLNVTPPMIQTKPSFINIASDASFSISRSNDVRRNTGGNNRFKNGGRGNFSRNESFSDRGSGSIADYGSQRTPRTQSGRSTPSFQDVSTPRSPFLYDIASKINSFDALIKSDITPPQPVIDTFDEKKYNIEAERLMKYMQTFFKVSPYMEIICDPKDGHITLKRISFPEDFETSGCEYCPFHSGSRANGFEPISEFLRTKSGSSSYGFITREGKAYDHCYMSNGSSNSSTEVSIVQDYQLTMIKSLDSVIEDISSLNNLFGERKKSSDSKVTISQRLFQIMSSYIADLGETPDKRFKELSDVFKMPIFQYKIVDNGQGLDKKYEDLPLTNYHFMSSFFENESEVIESINPISIKVEILVDDNRFTVKVPEDISAQILSYIPSIRNGPVQSGGSVSKKDNKCVARFIKYPILFQVMPNNLPENFDDLNVIILCSPIYDKNSYESIVYNLGNILAAEMDFPEFAFSDYSLISKLGECYISNLSDIVFNLLNIENDQELSFHPERKFVYDISNVTFSINAENIEETIESINVALNSSGSRYIRFSNEYNSIEIEREHAIDLLSNLQNVDPNKDIDVVISMLPLTDYNIHYFVTSFFDIDFFNKMLEVFGLDEDDEDISETFRGPTQRKFLLFKILFSSNVKNLRYKDRNINLSDSLKFANPQQPVMKLEPTISKREASKYRMLLEFMRNMAKIDIIALKSLTKLVNMFGREMSNIIFSGRQMPISGVLTGLTFDNKQEVIECAIDIYNERRHILDMISMYVVPFLDKVGNQDSGGVSGSAYFSTLAEYVLYSKIQVNNSDNDLAIPTSPLYSEVDIESHSCFDAGLFQLSYDPDTNNELGNLVLSPVETRAPSEALKVVMRILYSELQLVPVDKVFDNFVAIVSKSRFARSVSILDLIDTFSQIFIRLSSQLGKSKYGEIQSLVDEAFGLKLSILNANSSRVTYNGVALQSRDVDNMTNEIVSSIANLFTDDENYTITVNGERIQISVKQSFIDFISSFSESLIEMSKRRIEMRKFVKTLISNLYEPAYNASGVKINNQPYTGFVNEDIENKNGSRQMIDPNQIDIIEMAKRKVEELRKYMDLSHVDRSINNNITSILSKSYIGSFDQLKENGNNLSIDLGQKKKIFDKFYEKILRAKTKDEFNLILNSISNYLFSNLPRGLYKIFYERLYSNKDSFEGIADFKKLQANFSSNITMIQNKKTEKKTTELLVKDLELKIADIDEKILSLKTKLSVQFVEFITIIDLIVKKYEVRKKSYNDETDDFKDIIENMKMRLEFIKKSYSNIDDIDFKITLSIQEDSMDMFNKRKELFENIRFNESNFYSIIKSAFSDVRLHANLSFEKQKEKLNERLSQYGILIDDNKIDVENRIRLNFPQTKFIEVRDEYYQCRFILEMFKLLNEEKVKTRSRLFTYSIDSIEFPKSELRKKIPGYGNELNFGFQNKTVDQFTKQKLASLSKNIYELINIVQNAMSKVIDCGPGLHLFSDSIENMISFLTLDPKSENVPDVYSKFVESFNRFLTFNKKINRSVSSMIESSDFRVFVSILNGKMKEISDITKIINYFDTLPSPFHIYENITVNLVRGILVTFEELSSMDTIPKTSTVLEKISLMCGVSVNLSEQINVLDELNRSCINFIDEYYDDNGVMMNDEEVAANYNAVLTTRSNYMKPLFVKINRVVEKFIESEYSLFEETFIKRFVSYSELFSDKMSKISNLEKFMLKR